MDTKQNNIRNNHRTYSADEVVGGARPIAAANPGRRRRTLVIGIGVVLVAAAAIVVLTLKNSRADQHQVDAIAVQRAGGHYSATVSADGTIVAGPDEATTKLDVYEDFLCPVCGRFEKQYGAQIDTAITVGALQVRYHIVNMLDANSAPAGYSTRAANAAIAAAEAGMFADYRTSLFGSQPVEGKSGWTDDQLIDLGRRLGIRGDRFARDVTTGAYRNLTTAQFDRVKTLDWYKGTPTVRNGDTTIDVLGDPQWLDKQLH
ncbi:thioredoxin domain-containing protein [Amycolatopsis sp. PS_44_ISF1]|uniref:DsbA family protein n=1 Tax=Amycolatopsis sp. PS_44_ISF1 TaxID=2974917 RepID=UPI0028DD70EF|nr:thioredoxin domain-containing protein [Amycolatopsis sp. PS_44_ISF1]MDT8913719.1 DsbA family protein [Amycolatopsis sp. PS_44_ISF1]